MTGTRWSAPARLGRLEGAVTAGLKYLGLEIRKVPAPIEVVHAARGSGAAEIGTYGPLRWIWDHDHSQDVPRYPTRSG